jgi:hypothetical protein
MRALFLTVLLLPVTLALAQPVGQTGLQRAPALPELLQNPERKEGLPVRRVERIRIEDSNARIDEVRVGGESQSVTVQPKGDLPAYEMQPTDGARSRVNDRDIRGGPVSQRVWNLFRF